MAEKKEKTLENVLVESWNDLSELEISQFKWSGITINHSYHFRTLSIHDAVDFRAQMTVKRTKKRKHEIENINFYNCLSFLFALTF